MPIVCLAPLLYNIIPSASSSTPLMLALEGRRESGRETVSPVLTQDRRRESGRETGLPTLGQDVRRESGRESVEVRQGREAETAWWEESETKGIPVFGWFFGGSEGGGLVAAYMADGQAKLLTAAQYQEETQRAQKHLLGEAGGPPAQYTINVSAPVQLGAKSYLSEYARERRSLPRQEL